MTRGWPNWTYVEVLGKDVSADDLIEDMTLYRVELQNMVVWPQAVGIRLY